MSNFFKLILGKNTDINNDFDLELKKINESMAAVYDQVNSLTAEVIDLQDRIARKDAKIAGLEELLVLEDSKFIDPVTMLFNREYYNSIIKPSLSKNHKVLKIKMRHLGPETLALKLELSKALKLFSERYHDELILWRDDTLIMLYEDKKQISKKVQQRLIDVLDDIITTKDFLNISLTTMSKIEGP